MERRIDAIRFVFCLLCGSAYWATSSASAEAAVCAVRSVTIRGDLAGQVSAIPCTNLNLTLVNVRDYLPARDDDFGFLVFKGIGVAPESEYQVNGFSADEHAISNVDFYSLTLPTYVKVESRQVHTLTETNSDLPQVTIPQERQGIVIVELLGYMPAGDGDFEYVINPQRSGDTTFFITRVEKGNANSKVMVRVTVLSWPRDIDVAFEDGSLIEVMNRETRSAFPGEWATFSFTAPLAYVPRGAKDYWFVTRSELADGRVGTRVTTGGGRDNSVVVVYSWSLKFPLVFSPESEAAPPGGVITDD